MNPASFFGELGNSFLGFKYLNFLMRIQIRDPILIGLVPRFEMEEFGSATLPLVAHENEGL
jgi:hypothetical protein